MENYFSDLAELSTMYYKFFTTTHAHVSTLSWASKRVIFWSDNSSPLHYEPNLIIQK